MTEQESEVIARWTEGLPTSMLNTAKKEGRSLFYKVVGWLLFDWFFPAKCTIRTEVVNGSGKVYHFVALQRFGEVHSFIMNDNMVMSAGVSIKHSNPKQLMQGFMLKDDKRVGTVLVPSWAVVEFLEVFAPVFVARADAFTDEIKLAEKKPDGSPANVTIH